MRKLILPTLIATCLLAGTTAPLAASEYSPESSLEAVTPMKALPYDCSNIPGANAIPGCGAEFAEAVFQGTLCIASSLFFALKVARTAKKLHRAMKASDLDLVETILLGAASFLCGNFFLSVSAWIGCMYSDQDDADYATLVGRHLFREPIELTTG